MGYGPSSMRITTAIRHRSAALAIFAALAGGTACDTPRPGAPTEDAGGGAAEAGATSAAAPANETLEQRARRIHAEAVVIDTHNDITSVMLATGIDLGDDGAKDTLPNLHTDLARMRAGGVTGEFFSIYVDKALAEKPSSSTGGPARRALDLIDVVYQQVERHPETLVMATRAADVRRAKKEGKIACLMGIEGGHAIENSLFALRDFYRLGVRYMTLTHTNTNDWADSAGFAGPPVVRHHGLSPFGERVVAEMQRVGMLVDVSHVSDEMLADVLAVAKAPVIASHSSVRALAGHRRISPTTCSARWPRTGRRLINFGRRSSTTRTPPPTRRSTNATRRSSTPCARVTESDARRALRRWTGFAGRSRSRAHRSRS